MSQRRYQWGEGETDKPIMNKWNGGAIAVFKEMRQDESGPRIHWVAHDAQLLRRAPEHVRPDVSDQECALLQNLTQAKDTLGNVRRTGVTQFHDISSQQ